MPSTIHICEMVDTREKKGLFVRSVPTGSIERGSLPYSPQAGWVEARAERLRPDERRPTPAWFETQAGSASLTDRIGGQLAEHGLAGVRLDQPLELADFIRFGEWLGRPIPESDPSVATFVEQAVVLNLRGEVDSGAVALAPFTTRELTLHTEGSRRPADGQPRYIVLMCLEPGDDVAQTLLVPASAVLAALDATVIETLMRTRERVVDGSPPILREEAGTLVFSFRDLGEEPFDWESTATAAEVEAALSALLTACYTVDSVYQSQWRRGDLLVIDNRRWFHGRSGAHRVRAAGRVRHLRRLRIAAAGR